MIETPFGSLAAGPATRPPARRSYWVVEGALAAGAYPEETLETLLEVPVTAFLNLTEDLAGKSPDGLLTRYDGGAKGRATILRRPIPDLGLPSDEAMVETLDDLDRLLGDGHVVYTHCYAGIGRTGTVVGCWLVRHGVDPARALDVLAGLRRQDRVAGRWPSPQTRRQRRYVERWRPGR